MGRAQQRKCRHCAERFTPDTRNAYHQCYCTAPGCKAASKRASQAKWLGKPENRDYHRGADAVARVQAWRRAHPGYSRRKVDVTVAAEVGSVVSVGVVAADQRLHGAGRVLDAELL
jgi:hypothetical protein